MKLTTVTSLEIQPRFGLVDVVIATDGDIDETLERIIRNTQGPPALQAITASRTEVSLRIDRVEKVAAVINWLLSTWGELVATAAGHHEAEVKHLNEVQAMLDQPR